ncbi:CABIT domain-containing protein [Trichonephila clavipes]|nr:CABIT domain-containing protein [Trichonephila clavipes]
MNIEWSRTPLSIYDFITQCKLPQVVKIHHGEHKRLQNPGSLDLQQPILLYKVYTCRKIHGRALSLDKKGRIKPSGPTLIIPDSYPEESTSFPLSDIFLLITERNIPPFLWCPPLMLLAPQYPVFPAGCSQRDAPDWTLGLKVSLCKIAVDCLPENSSSRHSSKDTSRLRSRCPPTLSCA